MESNIPKYLLMLFLLVTACKEKTRLDKKNLELSNEKNECLTRERKENIVSEILNTDNIRNYLHLELKERHPVRLVKKGFVSNLQSFNLNSGVKVEMVDSIPEENNKLILSIDLDSCNWKKGSFFFYSPLENVEVSGKLIYKDTSFFVKVIKDIEF